MPTTPHGKRFALRRVSNAAATWLEDLAVSGLNLQHYGRYELQLYKSNSLVRRWRWSKLELQGGGTGPPSGPQLASFTYGPRPEDWDLLWELGAEDYLRDFWSMVDARQLYIPGEWTGD